jgi:hypothetical protein
MRLPFEPWYDKSKFVFWFTWAWIAISTIGFIVYLIFISNNSSVYTWFKNPGAPGSQLSSKRGTFEDIAIRLSIAGNILAVVFICSMVTWRKNFGCNILWIVLFAIASFLTLLGILAMGRMYSECNGQLQYGNICNDQNWCCVNEIFSVALNGCPNTVPCAVPKALNDLHPKADFLGLFWTNFILFVFQCAMIVFVLVFWSWPKPEGGTTEGLGQESPEPIPKQPEKIEPVPNVTEFENAELIPIRKNLMD